MQRKTLCSLQAMNLREIQNIFKSSLIKLYDNDEASAITRLVLSEILGYSSTDLVINGKQEVSIEIEHQLFKVLDRLNQSEPMQYALGTAWFYGLKLIVSPQVLIPRPETEELVDWIIDENKNASASILDIGTGSGCIAISLASRMDAARVTAMDISKGALEIARKNAALNKFSIEFIHSDILNPGISGSVYDIIVSNPPYILQSERNAMDKHVLEFEPHIALFVSDNDPLLFYRAIVKYAAQNLKPGGYLYFEINPSKADELVALLQESNYKEIILKKDMQGKDRMMRGTKH